MLSLLQDSPEELLLRKEASIEAVSEAPELVTLRQECLALTQLACHDDRFQVGRASLNLAQAYLDAGTPEAAIWHAERAEALLLAEAGRTEAALLLPTALLALATALARQAAVLASGKRGRAEEGKQLYRRAAAAFTNAKAASDEVFGRGHLECCPILRGWAHMAIARSADYETASQLLGKEMEIRERYAGGSPNSAEGGEMQQLKHELAQMKLAAADRLQPPSGAPPAGAPPAGEPPAVAGAKAARAGRRDTDAEARKLREEAVQLLQPPPPAEAAGGAEVGEARESALPLQAAMLLGEACKGLRDWEGAASAYARAAELHEEEHGSCDKRTVSVWTEVADLRLRLHRYAEAAADYEHVLATQAVLHGGDSAELIATAEKLCKARVMLRHWADAKAALEQARQLSSYRNGAEHAKTKHLEQVMLSLEGHIQAEARE